MVPTNLLILASLVLASCYAGPARESKCNKLCKCKTGRRKAGSSNRVSLFIPNQMNCTIREWNYSTALPSVPRDWIKNDYNTDIFFDNSTISTLTRAMMSQYNVVMNLSLSFRNVSLLNITENAFRNLTGLKTLDLSENQVNQSELRGAFIGLSHTRLRWLNISSMGLHDVSNDFFEPLAELRMDLTFRNNSIQLPLNQMMKMTNLRLLDVGSNGIRKLSLENVSFPKIEELNFDNNDLFAFPNFCYGQSSSHRFPSLRSLSIQWNDMRYIDVENYSCLLTLKRLTLNGNLFQKLITNQFAGLPNLYKITLSYVGCAMKTIEPAVFNNTNLKQIFFRENHIWFRKAEMSLRIFEGCDNLELLNLNNNVFQLTTEEDFTILLGHLTRLQVLVMGGCAMTFIPKVISERLVNIESLALYANQISELGKGTFVYLKKLRKLFVGSNKLTIIDKSSFPQWLIDNATDVEFYSNDFSCTCDLVWYIDWMKRKPEVFLRNKQPNRKRYNCSSPADIKGRSLFALDISVNTCLLDRDMKVLTLTLSILMIVSLLVGSLFYRYRWHIRYFVYMLRYNNRSEISDTRVYDYDAFVAYASEDRHWVIKTLLPVVEKQEGLKLCVHDRDFEVGNLIVDNIVDGIEKSRKIIMVLSNQFAKSDWCQFELNLIQRHVLENGQRLLVVVVLEDIQTRHVTKALKVMLQTTTYLLWGDEPYARKAFFNRLRLLLRRQTEKKALRRMSL